MILTTSFQKIAKGAVKTYGQATDCYLELWGKYNSQDIVNNRSNVTIELRLHVGSGYIGNYQATWWSIGGALSNSGNLGSGSYRTMTLGSVTDNISHSGDGTKSVSFTGGFDPTAWTSVGALSVSGSCDLPTIPRASEISSVTTSNIGTNPTIKVDRKSSSFTHTITYSFGSLSGTIVTKSSLLTIDTWTIPTTFYAQIPNSKTGSGTLYITTYNGNTQIGDTKSKTFYVSMNENTCKPSVNATVVDSNSTTVSVTGNSSILVAGKSTASVSYTATPQNSASIKTITVNNSSAYSGTSSSTVSGTKAISNFNASSINIVAKDSREYPNTRTLIAGTDYTLVNYTPLTFNGSVSRQTPTGDVLLLTFSGKYYSGNIGNTTNSLTIIWKYRLKGASSWTNGGTLTQGTHYTINTFNNTYSSGSGSSQSAISLGSGFVYTKDYEIGIFYNDVLESAYAIRDGRRGQPVFEWGNGWFNVNGAIFQNNKSIISSGGTSEGSWVIYSDGTMIQWNNITVDDQAINSSYGSIYTGTRKIYFPKAYQTNGFIGFVGMFKWGTGGSWGAIDSYDLSGAYMTIRAYDYFSRSTGTDCYISWMTIGKARNN